MYALARNLLFRLDAEHAHELTLGLFKRLPHLSTAPFRSTVPPDPVCLFGVEFPNRIGLAAGLDKNGECLQAWQALGFGFVEVGTVTPRPQPGNPKPRMFRIPSQQAIINRLGFNNKGVDHLLQQVEKSGYRGVLGINIGKNFDTPIDRAPDDYLQCLRKVYARASYVTVNVSSPNTRNLRDLQDEGRLRELLGALDAERRELAQRYGKHTPMLLKIAPDVSDAQLDGIAQAVCDAHIEGLIATNTTISRPGLEEEPLAQETGGLSGAPLRALADATLAGLRQRMGSGYPLIGVGGIVSGDDARAKRAAGADLLQIYTGFIYRGPALIAEIGRAIG
ncbi:quinone-dependent dihydroorotate dehydrogenase [Sinimarinibacterium sp. CAU 1509]|uniref:quinone-dependent dihydroorotate dehydrogenase n=1 Tax=Sinimarinibacterium sp. CAU 1509 TaxID=2562283 RepID=UPI0010AC001F|nr:quinone-dependent dihydroorotate dehydrogenase [Sinimarinibacterium sp. CAU 1509]TJY62299.1 quinone-dependent dihydroorotate dehydrogenase [Sinimarinibacterium sp. CAU 1509]